MFGLLDLMTVGHLGGIRFSHFDCIGLVHLEASRWQTTMTLRTVFGIESNTELCTICCAETKSLSDPLFALFDPRAGGISFNNRHGVLALCPVPTL
jgi:hypothetical protein